MKTSLFDRVLRLAAWGLLLAMSLVTFFVFRLVLTDWLVIVVSALLTLALVKLSFRVLELGRETARLRSDVDALKQSSAAPAKVDEPKEQA